MNTKNSKTYNTDDPNNVYNSDAPEKKTFWRGREVDVLKEEEPSTVLVQLPDGSRALVNKIELKDTLEESVASSQPATAEAEPVSPSKEEPIQPLDKSKKPLLAKSA